MSVLNFPLAKHWSLNSLNPKQSADYDAAVCALHPVSAVLPLCYGLNLLLMFNVFCIVYEGITQETWDTQNSGIQAHFFICQLEQTNILGGGYNICSAVSHCVVVSALSGVVSDAVCLHRTCQQAARPQPVRWGLERPKRVMMAGTMTRTGGAWMMSLQTGWVMFTSSPRVATHHNQTCTCVGVHTCIYTHKSETWHSYVCQQFGIHFVSLSDSSKLYFWKKTTVTHFSRVASCDLVCLKCIVESRENMAVCTGILFGFLCMWPHSVCVTSFCVCDLILCMWHHKGWHV